MQIFVGLFLPVLKNPADESRREQATEDSKPPRIVLSSFVKALLKLNCRKAVEV
jgi:hypothetical protein